MTCSLLARGGVPVRVPEEDVEAGEARAVGDGPDEVGPRVGAAEVEGPELGGLEGGGEEALDVAHGEGVAGELEGVERRRGLEPGRERVDAGGLAGPEGIAVEVQRLEEVRPGLRGRVGEGVAVEDERDERGPRPAERGGSRVREAVLREVERLEARELPRGPDEVERPRVAALGGGDIEGGERVGASQTVRERRGERRSERDAAEREGAQRREARAPPEGFGRVPARKDGAPSRLAFVSRLRLEERVDGDVARAEAVGLSRGRGGSARATPAASRGSPRRRPAPRDAGAPVPASRS